MRCHVSIRLRSAPAAASRRHRTLGNIAAHCVALSAKGGGMKRAGRGRKMLISDIDAVVNAFLMTDEAGTRNYQPASGTTADPGGAEILPGLLSSSPPDA